MHDRPPLHFRPDCSGGGWFPRGCWRPNALERQQALEKRSISPQRDAQRFCGRLARLPQLRFQAATFGGEGFGEALHHLSYELIALSHGPPRVIHEAALYGGPTISIVTGDFRRKQRLELLSSTVSGGLGGRRLSGRRRVPRLGCRARCLTLTLGRGSVAH